MSPRLGGGYAGSRGGLWAFRSDGCDESLEEPSTKMRLMLNSFRSTRLMSLCCATLLALLELGPTHDPVGMLIWHSLITLGPPLVVQVVLGMQFGGKTTRHEFGRRLAFATLFALGVVFFLAAWAKGWLVVAWTCAPLVAISLPLCALLRDQGRARLARLNLLGTAVLWPALLYVLIR